MTQLDKLLERIHNQGTHDEPFLIVLKTLEKIIKGVLDTSDKEYRHIGVFDPDMKI